MNPHDSLRDLGIGVGDPAGGLLIENALLTPVVVESYKTSQPTE
jgi:hypothetical protein